MTAPWEKYAQGDGPWSKYAGSEEPAPIPARQRVPDIPGTPEGYADRVAMIPGAAPGTVAPPAQRAAPVPQEERGLFARIRAGLEAARYTVASIVPGAVGYGVGVLEGITRAATNTPPKDWKPGENLAERRAQQFVEATVNKPPTALGREYAQGVGEFMQRHGASVAAGPLGVVGTGRHTRAVGDVRTGLRAALGTPGDAPPGLPPVAPSAEKPAGGLAKRVVQPNPALLETVPAAEKAGLTVLPHHVAEGDAVRALGTAAGGDVYKQNTKAFTKALIKELDPEEKSVRLDTKTFHRVLDKQGKTIGENMAKYDMPVDDALRARLEAISKDAADNADADTGRMTMNRVREILGKAEAGEGRIAGQAVRELDTAIGRQIRSNTKNQDLVARLRAVQDVLRDAAERQMKPDEAKAVQQARRRYAYAMEILPDIDDFGRTGYYEPGQLWKRLTATEAGRQRVANERGGLTDLAKAGALVADRSGTGHGYVSVGSSGVGVGASGMRAYASPSRIAEVAIGAIGGKKAYNRFGPNLVKRLAAEHDAEMARAAQAPEPPPLELAPEGAPTPQGPRPDVRGGAPVEVPEWVVGVPDRVARPGDQIPAIDPEGLLSAVGDDTPPARIIHGAGETRRIAPQTRAVDPEDPGALPQEEAPRKLRGPAEPAVTTAGQVAAQRAAQPPLVERTPAEIGEGVRRPRVPDIPAVPGRPDMPDVMVAGGPGEVAGNLASGVTGAGRKGPLRETTGTAEAMQSPGAALAREQQGFAPKKPEPPSGGGGGGSAPPSGGLDPRLAKIAELRRQAPSAAVKKVLDAREAEIKKIIKRETDIAELEAAAQATDDVDLRQSLLAEANKLRGQKIPVGEVTEGMPDLPKPKTEKIPVGQVIEGQPDLPVGKTERIPVGEATEITPEVVEAAPERLPVGEATEMPERLPVGEVVEDPIPVGEAMEFEPLPVGEVTEITPEVVKPARRPVVPEATNVDNAPTAPAGGGRSEGMEQTKITHAGMEIEEIPGQGGEPTRWQVTVPETGERVSTPSGLDAAKRIAENERKVIERSGTLAQRMKAAEEALAAEERSRTEAKKARSAATAGKSLAEIKAMDHMNRTIRVDGKDMKAHEFVDARLAAGDIPKIEMVDRVAPMSRTAFNRASNAEQRAHEAKVKAGGKKETYWLGGYGLSKTEYDYAVKKAAAQQETPRAPQEVTQQAGVPAEPQGRTGGREATEAGAGDRVQRAAEGGGQAEGAKKEAVKPARPAPKPTGKALAPAEVVKPARRPVVPEATNVDNAPTAPAGGGRGEGMEQTVYFLGSADKYDQASIYRAVGAFGKEQVWRGPASEAMRKLEELKKTTAQQETPRAPQEVTQQAGVPAEPQGRTGGREAAEAGAGDRVQRAAEGGGQAQEPDALSLTPKQYHEAKLRRMADENGVSMSEVREMYDTEAGRAENVHGWVSAIMAAAKAGKPISRATLDKLEEVRPRAVGQLMHDYPHAKLPEGYQVPGARKAEAEESAARRANRAAAKRTVGKALSPAEVKAEFQRQIDAVPRFDDGGPETITLKAGGSTVKLQNTARRVAEYMKALDTVKGGKTPKPVPAKTWLGGTGKRDPLNAIKDMIDDLDPQAAVDFAAAQGIDLEVALKDDRKRLDQVRNLKPTPETP